MAVEAEAAAEAEAGSSAAFFLGRPRPFLAVENVCVCVRACVCGGVDMYVRVVYVCWLSTCVKCTNTKCIKCTCIKYKIYRYKSAIYMYTMRVGVRVCVTYVDEFVGRDTCISLYR